MLVHPSPPWPGGLAHIAADFQWHVRWRSDNPKRQRGDAFAGTPVPALRSCEKLASLLSKGLETGWGRRFRFRLPGQFFTPSDAWGHVECVNRRDARRYGLRFARSPVTPTAMATAQNGASERKMGPAL